MFKKKNKQREPVVEVLSFKDWKDPEFTIITDFQCESKLQNDWNSYGPNRHYNIITGLWEDADDDDNNWNSTRYMC